MTGLHVVLIGLHTAAMVCILACMVDASRILHWHENPGRALAYVVIGTGAFGELLTPAAMGVVLVYETLFSIGLAVLCAQHLLARLAELRPTLQRRKHDLHS